ARRPYREPCLLHLVEMFPPSQCEPPCAPWPAPARKPGTQLRSAPAYARLIGDVHNAYSRFRVYRFNGDARLNARRPVADRADDARGRWRNDATNDSHTDAETGA